MESATTTRIESTYTLPSGARSDGPAASPPVEAWPQWQRVLFRFFFVYFVVHIEPWNWFAGIPGVFFVLRPYRQLVNWAVTRANANLFHTYERLVLPNGSGDTSWAWTRLELYLILAVVGCGVGTGLERK